jgi:hypothetical protein
MDFLNKPSPLRATFYKDADGQRDLVEIRIVGDTNSLIQKVKPEHVDQFPNEWAAYQARQEREPEPETSGTSLLEVPGIDRVAAAKLKMFQVRNAEELAALDEGQARALGMSGLTFWKSAKQLIKLKQLEKLQAVMETAPEPEKRKPGRPPKTEEAIV